MNASITFRAGPRLLACVGFALLLLAGAVPPAARASGDREPGAAPAAAAGSLSPPLADGWGGAGKVWQFFESFLGSRRRMFQVATVGMCIALYIMFRSRG